MIVNNIGLTEDSYSHIYTADGSEIGTVYDAEGYIIYYMYRDTIGDGSRVFVSYGVPIKDYRIYGNTVQDGTPTPDNPVDVVGVGEYDAQAGQYKIPVTVTNGTDTITTPIYIGSEPLWGDCVVSGLDGTKTVNFKKIVLTGDESASFFSVITAWGETVVTFAMQNIVLNFWLTSSTLCSHLRYGWAFWNPRIEGFCSTSTANAIFGFYPSRLGILENDTDSEKIVKLRNYLRTQYTAGTPVTFVANVRNTEITQIPLPELPTLPGTNTLTINTTVKPSEVDLTGRLKTSGYGQLLDKNLTAINDSTGTPIFIRG